MWRQFVRFRKRVELGVFRGDGEDFVIALAAIDHRHQADRPSLNQRQRINRFLTEYEYVEWVVVLGQRLRDEAVIRGVIDCGMQHSIQPQHARLLVEFVLDA